MENTYQVLGAGKKKRKKETGTQKERSWLNKSNFLEGKVFGAKKTHTDLAPTPQLSLQQLYEMNYHPILQMRTLSLREVK